MNYQISHWLQWPPVVIIVVVLVLRATGVVVA